MTSHEDFLHSLDSLLILETLKKNIDSKFFCTLLRTLILTTKDLFIKKFRHFMFSTENLTLDLTVTIDDKTSVVFRFMTS